MSMSRRLLNFYRRSWTERCLFFQAYCLLGVARLAINTLAFKRLAGWLGEHRTETSEEISESQLAVSRRVSWAVQSASRFTLWRSNCFPQAITAQYLLRRRGVPTTMYLGCLIEDAGEMEAHAWLRSGCRIVTGRQGHQRFGVVATFADRRASVAGRRSAGGRTGVINGDDQRS